jgi:hypothetical protein
MHIPEIYDLPSLTDAKDKNSFLATCLTVYQSLNPYSRLKNTFESFRNDSNYLVYDAKEEDRSLKDLYEHSIHFHELRHFHDFIESPCAFHFIVGSINNWIAVKTILAEAKRKKFKLRTPALSEPHILAELVTENAVSELFITRNLHDYFLKPIPSLKSNKRKSLTKDDFILISPKAESLPPIPALRTGSFLIPFSQCAIMEGSAVLSQLSWTLSTFGPEAAKCLWNGIKRTATKQLKHEYLVCLLSLEKLFGIESLYDLQTIQMFRLLFRFAFDGSLPLSFLSGSEDNKDEIKDSPAFRFSIIIYSIQKFKLQSRFLNGPNDLLSNLSNDIFPDWINSKLIYRNRFQGFLDQYEDNRSDFMDDLQFTVSRQLLSFHSAALAVDTAEVDRYLDILWNDQYQPELLEPPIQIFGIDKNQPLGMTISDKHGDSDLWYHLFLLESISTQFLNSDQILCPLSNIKGFCQRPQVANSGVPIGSCSKSCPMKGIMKYFGLC